MECREGCAGSSPTRTAEPWTKPMHPSRQPGGAPTSSSPRSALGAAFGEQGPPFLTTCSSRLPLLPYVPSRQRHGSRATPAYRSILHCAFCLLRWRGEYPRMLPNRATIADVWRRARNGGNASHRHGTINPDRSHWRILGSKVGDEHRPGQGSECIRMQERCARATSLGA